VALRVGAHHGILEQLEGGPELLRGVDERELRVLRQVLRVELGDAHRAGRVGAPERVGDDVEPRGCGRGEVLHRRALPHDVRGGDAGGQELRGRHLGVPEVRPGADEPRGDEVFGEVDLVPAELGGGLIGPHPGHGVALEGDGGREGIGAAVDVAVMQNCPGSHPVIVPWRAGHDAPQDPVSEGRCRVTP